MKLPFITGGDDCECKGTGKVLTDALVLREGKAVEAYGVCDCVKALEAVAVEKGYSITNREGDTTGHVPDRHFEIIPKEEP